MAQHAGTWDKTFPASDLVQHRKVSLTNRLGINIVADMYMPRDLDPSRRYPALIVGHPYGGVKEQTSGLYAQTMTVILSPGSSVLHKRQADALLLALPTN